MTLSERASAVATRVGGVLSILAIVAASVVGLHAWADREATDLGADDAGHGITG
jgi:hypothetical protein